MSRVYISTGAAARRMTIPPRTVRMWCQTGRIPGAQQPVPGGNWRIPSDALPLKEPNQPKP